MSAIEEALLAAAQLQPDDDVLVLGGGGGALALGAQARVGDGWIYVVREEVDELEELLAEAHAASASGVAYLVGQPPVLPLPDASVAAALGRVTNADMDAVAAELARVVSVGGRVALAADIRDGLTRAGFAAVDVVEVGGETVVSARRE